MHTVYALRTHHAAPAIASLVAAMLLSAPIEALPVVHALLRASDGQLVHIGLGLALFALLFIPAEQGWRRWRARRPSLVLVQGKGAQLPAGLRSRAPTGSRRPTRDSGQSL